MSFIDRYYAIFNNSVGQHSVTINRAEFANLLGVFSKQEQQLKDKEQECDELKKQQRCAWKSLEGTFCPEAQEQLDKLKAENQELTTKIESLNCSENCYKYKQTEKIQKALQEIKEIAEKAREDLYTCESISYADDDLCEIIQKISECCE